jgi:pyruvate/2-oxoglutarate/acetoin dehydrogenase E1 component
MSTVTSPHETTGTPRPAHASPGPRTPAPASQGPASQGPAGQAAAGQVAASQRPADRPPSGPAPVTMAAALNQALADSLAADERVVVFGEDVGTLGGVFRVTDGLALPVVIRVPFGGGIGGVEHHSDSSEAYYTHTPGLRVVSPGTPGDAYRLLRQAIGCPDPVIFLEPKRRYWSKETTVLTQDGPPIDRAVVRRPGRDVTLIAYGGMVATAIETAEAAVEEGWDVEVIDLRSLSPFDDQTLAESVCRTGRAVIVHEAAGFAGYGAEVAARLTEQCFHYLEAPILRVTGFDIPYPPPHLERFHLPSTDRILDAIARLQWEEDNA